MKRLKKISREIHQAVNLFLNKLGFQMMSNGELYSWQISNRKEGLPKGKLPKSAQEYLRPNNPRLVEISRRYSDMDKRVTMPLVWVDGIISKNELKFFRGDNAFVWQLRGKNMNILAYALTYYYILYIDYLKLLDRLDEDELFGIITFKINGRLVSRDLLDSILEIYFLENKLGLSKRDNPKILDIGAGYGRLAHRMVNAIPNVRYYCVDAVPVSSFVSEYYLKFRKLQDYRVNIILLDQIENFLKRTNIDIAVNIHSFSECQLSAIEWWISILKRNNVNYLMIVPNKGQVLVNNSGENFTEIILENGYCLMTKEPKFLDPIVQKYGINPTNYFLFKLK